MANSKAGLRRLVTILNLCRLEFTYKGRTSTLQSCDDIASWIEERKKRFPTAARKAENEERLQKLKEEREEKKRQASKAEKLLERQKKTLAKDKQALENSKQEAAAKAKLRVEKLRQKLMKEERRVAKAEAKSLKRCASPDAGEEHPPEAKRRRSKSDATGDLGDDAQLPAETESLISVGRAEMARDNQLMEPGAKGETYRSSLNTLATQGRLQDTDPPNPILDPLTPTSQPALPDQEVKVENKLDPAASDTTVVSHGLLREPAVRDHNALDSSIKRNEEENGATDSASSSEISLSSDDLSDDDADTSSSGSSSSSSDSDAEGPETTSSRRKGPRKIPPPKRASRQEKALCRDFLRTGRCRRGRRCRWRHALPERAQRKEEEDTPFRVERKSLHQRVCISSLQRLFWIIEANYVFSW